MKHSLTRLLLAVVAASVMAAPAHAKPGSPQVPGHDRSPGRGTRSFLVAHAVGVQIYSLRRDDAKRVDASSLLARKT